MCSADAELNIQKLDQLPREDLFLTNEKSSFSISLLLLRLSLTFLNPDWDFC